ncbi:MAG: hypothetical protein IPJ65_27640 [Archangiaceae bacterium]|nr:hypothetical protein [Archangiaceae bacterium]
MRVSRWLVIVALAPGCLRHDLSPLGYRCTADAECGDAGLACVRGLCAEPERNIRGLLRLNGPLGNQLLTFASEESDRLLAGGFTSDGAVVQASTEAAVNYIPIYRLLRPVNQDYLFTPDVSERDKAIALYGYEDQGIAFYAFPFAGSLGLPVYRLLKNGYRFYAVGEAQRDQQLQNAWGTDRTLFRANAP